MSSEIYFISDPLSGKRAYDGIYDFIDILGDDPSVTPHQLCHGHPSYRAVDLGVQIQGLTSKYALHRYLNFLHIDLIISRRLKFVESQSKLF